jgi:hypothetical protein
METTQTTATKEDTMKILHDSDTAKELTAGQLGIDSVEYRQLVRESMECDQP